MLKTYSLQPTDFIGIYLPIFDSMDQMISFYNAQPALKEMLIS